MSRKRQPFVWPRWRFLAALLVAYISGAGGAVNAQLQIEGRNVPDGWGFREPAGIADLYRLRIPDEEHPEPKILTLDKAISLALVHHPDISAARATLEREHAAVSIAKGSRLPVISYSFQPGYDPEAGRDSVVQASISARQTIYDFGQVEASVRAAEERQKGALAELDSQQENVGLLTTSAMAELAAQEATYRESQQQVAQLENIRTRIEVRVSAGLADLSDLRRTDAAIVRAQAEQDQVKAGLETARRQLALITGQEPAGIPAAPAMLHELAGAMTSGSNLAQSPVGRAADATVAAAEQDFAYARALRYPGISVGVANTSWLLHGKHPAGDSNFNNSTRFGIFLSGTISLGGQQRYQAVRAGAEAARARQDRASQLLALDQNILSAQTELVNAEIRDDALGRVALILSKSRDLYWDEYLISKRRLTEVFDVEREIFTTSRERFQAQAERLVNSAKILAYRGQLVGWSRSPRRATK